MGVAIVSEREAFERLVAQTAYRPRSPQALRLELERQLVLQSRPSGEGLGELAVLLAGWLGGERDLGGVAQLVQTHPGQPLVQFYAFAMRREAGDAEAAGASLAALRELDPGDPLAWCMRGPTGEVVRMGCWPSEAARAL